VGEGEGGESGKEERRMVGGKRRKKKRGEGRDLACSPGRGERKRGGKGAISLAHLSPRHTRTHTHTHHVMNIPGEREQRRINRRGEPPGKWKRKRCESEQEGKLCTETERREGNERAE
jgi:hypothetical protein